MKRRREEAEHDPLHGLLEGLSREELLGLVAVADRKYLSLLPQLMSDVYLNILAFCPLRTVNTFPTFTLTPQTLNFGCTNKMAFQLANQSCVARFGYLVREGCGSRSFLLKFAPTLKSMRFGTKRAEPEYDFLTHFTALEKLRIRAWDPSLSVLSNLTDLECAEVEMSDLLKLPHLTSLTNVFGFEPDILLSSVKKLSIEQPEFSLSEWTNLTSLSITDVQDATFLKSISKLTNLNELEMIYVDGDFVEPIIAALHTSLTSLTTIIPTNETFDLIYKMTQLRKLGLSQDDTSLLSSPFLTDLADLNLDTDGIFPDYSFLIRLPHLTRLRTLSPFPERQSIFLPAGLKVLETGKEFRGYVSHLTNLTKLSACCLQKHQISELTNLTCLRLFKTRDSAPLAKESELVNLTNLIELQFKANVLNDETVLRMPHLTRLSRLGTKRPPPVDAVPFWDRNV